MSLGFSCSHTGSRTSLSTWNEQEPGSPTLAILSSLGEGWSCLEHSFGTLCLVLCPSHFLVLDESRGGICLTGSQGLSSWARVTSACSVSLTHCGMSWGPSLSYVSVVCPPRAMKHLGSNLGSRQPALTDWASVVFVSV